MLRQIYRTFRSSVLHSVIPESKAMPFSTGNGIEVVGFFQSASGLGESARLCAQQLKDEGFKVRCTSVEHVYLKKPEIEWSFENTATANDIGVRIIHLNPPMIPPYVIRSGLWKFAKIFNIGYWAWELEKLPEEWIKAIRYMNAIISPSNFTTKSISNHTDKPVITVPHPVKVGMATLDIRTRLGLKKTDFIVSSIFSLASALERKNPQSLIKAFLQAFGNTDNAYLVFKVSGVGGNHDKLQQLSGGHKNILFVEDIWSRADILGLIQTSNVYASLHRAEGFGLTMAEAMMLGTSVMATSWSGNVDFCTEENSFPIDYTLVPVESGHAAFTAEGSSVWAEADTNQAAATLQKIYEHPEIAERKAHACLAGTNRYFSGLLYTSAFNFLTKGTH